MISLEAYWYIFPAFFYKIYTGSVILLIVLTLLFQDKKKGESYNFLYVFNTVFLWLSVTDFLIYLGDLFIAWYGQNSYEWYSFYDQSGSLSPRSFIIRFVIINITPFIFFLGKARANRVITMILLIIGHSGYLYLLLQNLFRDYLPSSWSTYTEESISQRIVLWFCLVLLVMFTYWIAHKRKKLPYSSIILKNCV